jgi:hypothetical protein
MNMPTFGLDKVINEQKERVNKIIGDVVATAQQKNVQESQSTDEKTVQDNTPLPGCMLDFGVLADQHDFGFGVQSFELNGRALKNVQQTLGKFNSDGEVSENVYIDSWWKEPETIVLAGVIELPYAYKKDMYRENVARACSIKVNPDEPEEIMSFFDIMEKLFSYDNNPIKINEGWELILHDYYLNKSYNVSFMNRNWSVSADQQSLLRFSFEFRVLNEVPV